VPAAGCHAYLPSRKLARAGHVHSVALPSRYEKETAAATSSACAAHTRHCQSNQQTAYSAPGQHARRQARAAGALHNLSADAAAIALIRSAGGVAPLVALLRRAACPGRDADQCMRAV